MLFATILSFVASVAFGLGYQMSLDIKRYKEGKKTVYGLIIAIILWILLACAVAFVEFMIMCLLSIPFAMDDESDKEYIKNMEEVQKERDDAEALTNDPNRRLEMNYNLSIDTIPCKTATHDNEFRGFIIIISDSTLLCRINPTCSIVEIESLPSRLYEDSLAFYLPVFMYKAIVINKNPPASSPNEDFGFEFVRRAAYLPDDEILRYENIIKREIKRPWLD
jgi:uncharacterized membrane protein